ncbi:xylulokinase [Micromonospora radicis]|uniref:Xylulose kinase n=1 Tax=Micromonospora radicis TaxID=1894971 RepID=A0A418MQ16_9ACTN|nr:FGGY-family carbohydrate kinase [Micromonospora radicis]RIV34579.1 hypothetical protein D2L64_21980 [Micromonospora radicis]
MTKRYLLGIDVGSSGIRAGVFEADGSFVAGGSASFIARSAQPGQLVYHDDDLRTALYTSIRNAIAKGVDPREIEGVSVAVPATLTMFDRDGGMPFHMMSVMDGRAGRYYGEARQRLEAAGLSLDDFFRINRAPMIWLTQFLALRDLYPAEFDRVQKVGLSGHSAVIRALGYDGYADTDDEAAFSNIYDVERRRYDPSLAAAFDIEPAIFAPFLAPGTPVGAVTADVAAQSGLVEGTRIYVGSSDSVAQTVALNGFDPDVSVLSLGTTGIVIKRTPHFIDIPDPTTTITTAGFDDWKVSTGSPSFGASYRWLKENICYGDAIDATDEQAIYERINTRAARSAIGANGVTFLPHFWGTLSNPFARTTLIGLDFTNTTDDVVRAVLEGTAFDLAEAIGFVDTAVGESPPILRTTGGGSQSPLWLQIIADVTGRSLELTQCPPQYTGCLGAAAIAGIGAGVYADHTEAAQTVAKVNRVVEADPSTADAYREASALYERAARTLSEHVYSAPALPLAAA